MTARLSCNLDVSNCLQWAELSGRLWAVNGRIMHSGESIGFSFSLLSSLLFQDILHHRIKIDDTRLDSESIIRPIYQLGSLYSINKHITSLLCSAPRDTVSTSSPAIRAHREDVTSIRDLCYTVAFFGCHDVNRLNISQQTYLVHRLWLFWICILRFKHSYS